MKNIDICTEQKADDGYKWYVMRDLKRHNDKSPAYKVLSEANFEVFTPMVQKESIKNGKKIKELVPYIRDLLFVHSSKEQIDSFIYNIPTLQYRFLKGGKYKEAIVVDDFSMNCFIKAVNEFNHKLCTSSQIDKALIGEKIKIVEGTLNGAEGVLLKIKGSRKKRVLIKLLDLMVAVIEIDAESIEKL